MFSFNQKTDHEKKGTMIKLNNVHVRILMIKRKKSTKNFVGCLILKKFKFLLLYINILLFIHEWHSYNNATKNNNNMSESH